MRRSPLPLHELRYRPATKLVPEHPCLWCGQQFISTDDSFALVKTITGRDCEFHYHSCCFHQMWADDGSLPGHYETTQEPVSEYGEAELTERVYLSGGMLPDTLAIWKKMPGVKRA